MTTEIAILLGAVNTGCEIRHGALRIWGEWFGRPYDNLHCVVRGSMLEGCLRLEFSAGEVLEVWNAKGVLATKSAFRIANASRVRWSWHPYQPAEPSGTSAYREYFAEKGVIRKWTSASPAGIVLEMPHNMPAVEFV